MSRGKEEQPQLEELNPDSMLSRVLLETTRRFRATQVDPRDGVTPYYIITAADDTVNAFVYDKADSERTAAIAQLVANLVSETSLTPNQTEVEDYIAGGSFQNWDEINLNIAQAIIEGEIRRRFPDLDEEDRRRYELIK